MHGQQNINKSYLFVVYLTTLSETQTT